MFNWLIRGIEGPLTALVALCAVAGAVVLLRRWQHRTGALRRATVESRADRRDADGVRNSLEELLAEVGGAAARLDERIASRLRELEAAEARIDARLAELRQAVACGSTESQTPAPAMDVATRRLNPLPAPHAPIPPASTTPIVPRSTKAIEPDSRFAAIYSLADAGATPPAVAEKTGLPLGEVETILGLRRIAAHE